MRISEPSGIQLWPWKFRALVVLMLFMVGSWPDPIVGSQERMPAAAARTPVQEDIDIFDNTPRVVLDYSGVPDSANGAALLVEEVQLRVANTQDAPVFIVLEGRSISGGEEVTQVMQKLSLRPFEKTVLPVSTKFMPVRSATYASQFLLSARILDAKGQFLSNTIAPPVYYHRDQRGTMYVYRELYNRGIIGPLDRSLSKADLEVMSKSDSIGIGRAGKPPAGARIQTGPVAGIFDDPLIIGTWVQICVVMKVNFSDNGYGETDWPNNADRLVPGVFARVRDGNGTELFEGFTDDGFDNNLNPNGEAFGCVPWIFSTTGTYNWKLSVSSRAKVKFNDIEVYKSADEEIPYNWLIDIPQVSGQTFISIPNETKQSSTLAAAAWSIYKHHAGLASGNYKIHTGTDSAGSCYHLRGDHKIRLTNQCSRKKFVVAHEMGHALLFERLGLMGVGNTNTSVNAPAPCDSNAGHTMWSKEYITAAFSEGFADFYAVDTWNDHNQQDGVYVSWDIPYEADPGAGNIWMRYHCQSPYIGHGNETDWMRFFWDFHTGGVSPHNPVSFDVIAGLIAFSINENGGPMTATNAYTVLREGAQAFNQGALWNTFFHWADQNGITY